MWVEGCPSLHPIYVSISISLPKTSPAQPGQARMSVRRERERKERGLQWGKLGAACCVQVHASCERVPFSCVCDSVLFSLCPRWVRSLPGLLCVPVSGSLGLFACACDRCLCVCCSVCAHLSLHTMCVWVWICVCESGGWAVSVCRCV